jgi:hypothetical protein
MPTYRKTAIRLLHADFPNWENRMVQLIDSFMILIGSDPFVLVTQPYMLDPPYMVGPTVYGGCKPATRRQ